MSSTVSLEGITKVFGDRYVLRDVSFSLQPTKVLALTGHNGSGKTTLLKIISTLLCANSGSLTLFGSTPTPESRRRIGLLLTDSFLFRELTVEENLIFYKRLYDDHGLNEEIETMLDHLHISSLRHEPVHTLSRGEKQKVALVRSLLQKPELLLWDEPTTGLDQDSKKHVYALIQNLKTNAALIIATHDTDGVSSWADDRIELNRGRIQ